jgi:quercetin dioxygenase-like cupin family protein
VSVDVIAAAEPIVRVNPYQDYQRGEGVPIVRGFHVGDLSTLDLAPWARKGGRGCFVNLDGTGGTNDAYVCEIAPGGSLNPQRQLFEEMVYVLEGSGSTQVWYDEGQKVSFEWRAGSVFAIPLNAWHRHFNGRGDRPARYLAVTNAPLIINVFHNLDFVFGNTFAFADRFSGEDDFFSGEGRRLRARRNLVLETNFVPDVRALELIGGARLGVSGRHLQEGAPPRRGRARDHSRRQRLLAALAGGRGAAARRLGGRQHGRPPGELVPPALQQRRAAGPLSGPTVG